MDRPTVVPSGGSTVARRLLVAFVIVALVVGTLPGTAIAQSEDGVRGTIVVEEGETVDEVNAVAGTVIVRGTVTGDVSALAGNVYVEGTVEGDVSAAAGNLEITGTVEGDVSSGAGNVVVAEGATVGGEFTVGAGNVRIDGAIGDDARIGAETIRLGEEASIGGDLTYDGDLEGDTAVVAGDVTRDRTIGPQIGPTIGPLAEWLFAVYAFALNLILGAILLLLLPGFSRIVADRVATDPLRTGAAGLVVLVGVPILLALAAITIVGLPFTVVGAFAFALLLWIGLVYGRFAVAAWLLSIAGVENGWLALVAGLLAGGLLSRVPIVGGVVDLLVLLLGLGAISAGALGLRRRDREAIARAGSEGPTVD